MQHSLNGGGTPHVHHESHVAHMHSNAPHVQHSLNVGEGPLTCSMNHVWLMCTVMPLMCSINSIVEGSPSHGVFTQWWRGTPHVQHESCVAHMHGNALTCSIHSMVEGRPSHAAFTQWWRGTPHVHHESHVAHMHSNHTCSIHAMVEGDPSHAT